MSDPFWSLNIGNILQLIMIGGGGLGVVITLLSKFGIVIYKLGALEKRVEVIELQNVLPISERRRVRR